MPECPAALSDLERAHWDELAPLLHSMGVLTLADRDVLASYCEAWSRKVKAQGVIRKSGPTYKVKTKDGAVVWRTRPEVSVVRGALADMHRLGAVLGLNPSARAGLNVAPKKEQDASPFRRRTS
jgi:P27 family predicted phage terminase small subunit